MICYWELTGFRSRIATWAEKLPNIIDLLNTHSPTYDLNQNNEVMYSWSDRRVGKPCNFVRKPVVDKLLCRLLEFVIAYHKKDAREKSANLRVSYSLCAVDTLSGMVFESGVEKSLLLNNLKQYVIGNYLRASTQWKMWIQSTLVHLPILRRVLKM